MNQAALELLIQIKDEASQGIGNIGSALSSIGGLAVAGVAVAGAALGGFLVSAVASAAEAEEAISQLDAVIVSTGGAAGVTSQEIQDLAGSLQKTTKFGEEATLGAASMLLTFTNIGKEVFPDVTRTALDMSQALGQDLKASSMQLGKALNDPIAGIGALSRVGVTFTEGQKEMIKAMVETGDTAGAQRVILAELSKEFGGSAAAAGKTFSGQMEIAKNMLGEFGEMIGGKVLPILTPLIGKFIEFATAALPKVEAAVSGLLATIDPILSALGNTLAVLSTNGFGGLFAVMEGGSSAISNLLESFGMTGTDAAALSATLSTVFTTIQTVIQTVITAITTTILPALSTGFTTLVSVVGVVVSAIVANWPLIQSTIETVVGIITGTVIPALTAGFDLIVLAVTTLVAAFVANWPLIQSTIQTVIGVITTTVLPALVAGFDLIVAGVTTLVTAFMTNWPLIQSTIQTVIGVITTTVLPVLVAGFNMLVELVGVIVASFMANWPMIQAAITNAVTAITTNVLPILNAALTAVIGFMAPIVAWVTANWPLIQATITRVIQAVSNIIQVALPAIKGIFDTVFPAIVAVVTLAINTVLDVIKVAMQLINGDTTGALETLRGIFERIWNAIKAVVDAIWPAIKATVAAGVGAVKDLIVSRMNDVLSFMGSMPEKFAAIGGDLMRGLWRGIQGLGAWFKSQFSAFISDMIPDFAKKALGVGSPSKVMAVQVGEPIVTGIMAGIASQAPQLKASMNEMIGLMTGNTLMSEVGRFGANANGLMPNMAGAGASGPVTINVYADVADDVDIDKLAYAVASRVQTRMSR